MWKRAINSQGFLGSIQADIGRQAKEGAADSLALNLVEHDRRAQKLTPAFQTGLSVRDISLEAGRERCKAACRSLSRCRVLAQDKESR